MLAIKRRDGQAVVFMLGEHRVEMRVWARDRVATLAIDAPTEVKIMRKELLNDGTEPEHEIVSIEEIMRADLAAAAVNRLRLGLLDGTYRLAQVAAEIEQINPGWIVRVTGDGKFIAIPKEVTT